MKPFKAIKQQIFLTISSAQQCFQADQPARLAYRVDGLKVPIENAEDPAFARCAQE